MFFEGHAAVFALVEAQIETTAHTRGGETIAQVLAARLNVPTERDPIETAREEIRLALQPLDVFAPRRAAYHSRMALA